MPPYANKGAFWVKKIMKWQRKKKNQKQKKI